MEIKYTISRAGYKSSVNVGDVENVPEKEAIRLIEAGKAKPVKTAKVETQMVPQQKETQSKNIYPKEKGSGWFECSDGKSIRGKKKAIEYESNL